MAKKPPLPERLKTKAKEFDEFDFPKADAALLREAANAIDKLPFCEWTPELTPGGQVSRVFRMTDCGQEGATHGDGWKFCPYCGQRLSLVTEWVVAALKVTELDHL